MKDENNGMIMLEFIGLRSKLYAIRVQKLDSDIDTLKTKLTENGMDQNDIDNVITNFGITKKAKGIKKSSLKTITFDDYYQCLFNNTVLETNQNLIRS